MYGIEFIPEWYLLEVISFTVCISLERAWGRNFIGLTRNSLY